MLTYGGLRGAVGLCLALILDGLDDEILSPKDKERLNFHMAGIALLTLLINGTTMRPLLQYLGMSGGAYFCTAAKRETKGQREQPSPYLDSNITLP